MTNLWFFLVVRQLLQSTFFPLPMNTFRVASLNINGGRDQQNLVSNTIPRKKLDVCFLQETHTDRDNEVYRGAVVDRLLQTVPWHQPICRFSHALLPKPGAESYHFPRDRPMQNVGGQSRGPRLQLLSGEHLCSQPGLRQIGPVPETLLFCAAMWTG